MQGPIRRNYVQWNLCKAHVDADSSIKWPRGDYSILEHDKCPTGDYDTHIILDCFQVQRDINSLFGVQFILVSHLLIFA